MKFANYNQYRSEDTARAESALLTVWAALGDLTPDLVLVGGLVPRYICRPPSNGLTAATMDVDLGISLELSTGQYESTSRRLADHGFEWKEKRFVKTVAGTELFLDFLTDKPTAQAADSVVVDDIAGISAVFGVSRALAVCRTINISGSDLQGANVTEQVKVCEVGPFICLKLQAYCGRAQGKDIFDFVRAIRDYDGGMDAAARFFHAEKGQNLAYEPALQILRERFKDARSKGPIQYADFCMSGNMGVSESQRHLRIERANEALDAAHFLLKTEGI